MKTAEEWALEMHSMGCVLPYPHKQYRSLSEHIAAIQLDAGSKFLDEVERLKKASVPVCIGREMIQILAAQGHWVSMDGQWLVAADGLFRKDPYAEIEKAWHEGFLSGDLSDRPAMDCWNDSRAKKVMEGKL